MTIGDIVTQLKYGELRSISIKDDNYAIVSYINLALVALYGRFNLLSNEVIIDLQDNVTEYTLPTDFMNLLSVTREDGTEYTIDEGDPDTSIYQVSFNKIQVPFPATGVSISVIYSANPTFLVYADESNLNDVVPLPIQLMEPLLHYIGYRAHGSMNGDIKAENNTHYMRYEASCKRVEELGLVRREVPSATLNTSEILGDHK